MSIALFVEDKTATKTRVMGEHYKPFDEKDGLSDEVLPMTVIVDSVANPPELKLKRGESYILYCNPYTFETWYEIETRPLTRDEEIEAMRENQELMQQALDELIFGGAI